MKTTIPIKQNNGDVKYYYDIEHRMLLLSNPIMDMILEKNTKKLESLASDEDKKYYKKKLAFLKRNGFWSNVDKTEEIDGELSPVLIESLVESINHIVFEVTDDCNLRCKYCGYGELYYDHDDRNKKYMSISDVKALMSYLYPYLSKSDGMLYFSFYGGEPLMNIKLIEQTVDYLESMFTNRSIRFSMTTNGILLNKYIDYLQKKNFRLLISFDGDRYNHSYRMFPDGSNSFDVLYTNVKAVKEKYPKFFDENVSFNAVIHNRNNIKDVEAFFLCEFEKTPRFSPLDNVGIRPEKIEEFKKMYNDMYAYLRNELPSSTEINSRFINDPFVFSLSVFMKEKLRFTSYDFYEDVKGIKRKHNIPGGTCLPFQKKLFVTVNKKILPCERIDQKYVLGTIQDSKVLMDFAKISELYNGIYKKMRSRCSVCCRGGVCSQCFFQIEHLDKHNMCPSFADKNRLSEEISNITRFVEGNTYIVPRIINEVVLR